MFSIGQRIRELRIKKGLSQSELANGFCTPSMISQIESDRARPSYNLLSMIAEKFTLSLEQLLAEVDLNMDAHSTRRSAQAPLAAKNYSQAIPLFSELLETRRDSIPVVEVYLDLVECYVMTLQDEQAEHLLREIQESAKIRVDLSLQAQTLKFHGLIALHRRQHLVAIYQWRKALELLGDAKRTHTDPRAEILNLLGELHMKLGLTQQATQYCAEAASLFQEFGDLRNMGKLYLQMSHSYKDLRNWDRSVDCSDQAHGIFRGLHDLQLSMQLKMHTATLYAQTGRELEAITMLQQVRSRFQSIGEQEAEGLALVELARIYLQLDQLVEALSVCDQALPLLPNLSTSQAVIHRLRGQIARKLRQHQEAIYHLRTAADCYMSLEEFGEWGETLSEVARVYAGAEDFKLAYAVLYDVRRYTQRVLHARGIVL